MPSIQLGDFAGLSPLDISEVPTDEPGVTARRYRFADDWRTSATSVPELLLGRLFIDDAPWSMVEWVSPDGEVRRVEMFYEQDGTETWHQLLVNGEEGYACPSDQTAVAARFATRIDFT